MMFYVIEVGMATSKTQYKTKKSGLLRSVFNREQDFTVKNISKREERLKALRLRHKIFCQELGWVPKTVDLMETDEYDKHAVFFGVFDRSGTLLAFIRLIKPENNFMMEKEFESLVSPFHRVRKEIDTVEVSRLCIAPEARSKQISGNFGNHSIAMLLYKSVYHWCRDNCIRYLYLVVEQKVNRLLCANGFPCRPIGEPVLMPDGALALAATLDWQEFETINWKKRPVMTRWFTQH
jgi:acyl homoserine lactone synthase